MSKSYVLVSFSEYIHVLGTSVLGELQYFQIKVKSRDTAL